MIAEGSLITFLQCAINAECRGTIDRSVADERIIEFRKKKEEDEDEDGDEDEDEAEEEEEDEEGKEEKKEMVEEKVVEEEQERNALVRASAAPSRARRMKPRGSIEGSRKRKV